MGDPHDDDTHAPTGAPRSVERVRARVSVTLPRIPQPTVSTDDDEDSIFGATLGGTAPAPRPAATPSGSKERTETTSIVPSPSSGSGPVERAPQPMATRTRSGLAVVRTADLQVAPLPSAPTLAPSLLPPRRTSTAAPAPHAELDPPVVPGGTAPPPPPALSTSITPRPTPPAPRAMTSLDPPIEPSQPGRRAPATMALDPPVEPGGGRTRPPTGLMSLDPPVEPSGKTKAPSGRPRSAPGLPTAIDGGPSLAPRTSLPSGLREDGTPLSAAEAALPGLFRSPEQVVQQRRRIQIAATGVAGIVLAIVTVVLWLANRPPPPKTGSVHFAVTDKAIVSQQYLAGLPRLDLPDVAVVVTRVVAPVARSLLPKGAPAPEVVLTRDAEAVALSTPDGRLVLSQGMLMTLSSQAELAALAAHLLAHQTRYHLDDAIDAEAKVLVPEVRAAVGSNMATPGGTRVATVGLWHTFSDVEEQEADAAAVLALKRANWDATALRTLWQRLDRASPKPALVTRHPLTPARMAALEAAEQLRLQGSDLVRGDVGRTNSVEYQAQIKDVIVPPVVVVAKGTAEEPATPTTSEPVVTRLTTPVAAPKGAPKKEPVPEPPPPPTPRSPRDAND